MSLLGSLVENGWHWFRPVSVLFKRPPMPQLPQSLTKAYSIPLPQIIGVDSVPTPMLGGCPSHIASKPTTNHGSLRVSPLLAKFRASTESPNDSVYIVGNQRTRPSTLGSGSFSKWISDPLLAGFREATRKPNIFWAARRNNFEEHPCF